MVAILKEWVRLIELAVHLRNLKDKGYTHGSWMWIPNSDKVEIRTWRSKKK